LAIAITASIVIIIVVAFYLVVGWIYSNGFRASALKPREPSRTYGVWVRSADGRTITVTALEPRQDIGHPGTLGLYWSGGYGHMGDVVAVDGLDVTRPFEVLKGDHPPVCPDGPSPGCDQVDIEAYAFPDDPGDVGLDFETVQYESGLGPVAAWVVPARQATRWAIHVHGWTAEKRESIRLLPPLNRAGLTSIAIDYRNDPGAPVDPSGHYRFGVTEWEDVEGAVSYAVDAGADDVVLVGYSTGAAHAMSFLERSELRHRVVGVVMDSPNINMLDAVRHGSKGLNLHPTPMPITRLMAEFGMWITDLRWKIDWDTTNYVQRAEAILQVQTLVFHGTSDQRIPISVSRQLEARAPEVVDLVETQAAGHVMSWNADPERYERYLTNFLDALPAGR
jgi:alpha-beta hydrolase superfamily lysophospholipase